ncbi:zinc finger protein 622 [Pectinophora gossypiella]|uniref:C2H2-type domain-containing protein n=1 Tax=Pectinophora gossypiella TaxID=13191 RepID=A0A1E1WBD2_PECGO|nr:zinc finger protein 622 [Pectinophora gossypiella]
MKPNQVFACCTCEVIFRTQELHRDHYRQDWHRYNLKRKVANLYSVTEAEYNARVMQNRQPEEGGEPLYCKVCTKYFGTQNALDNHLNSKKHKAAERNAIDEDSGATVEKEPTTEHPSSEHPSSTYDFDMLDADSCDEEIETDSEIEELDSDEWEMCRVKGSDSLIKTSDCLFCGHHSKNVVRNLKHMSIAHSFFIPDAQYCIDVKGLLEYLGEKISRGYMCLWCNESGKTFYSMDAARKHMISKGHCKMLHEGLALAEYADYYDYSSSYPEYAVTAEDEDSDEEVYGPTVLEGDDYQLVLPSGAAIGHRSLMKYYKQNVNPDKQFVLKKPDRKLNRLLGMYRGLGWHPKDQALSAKNARDIQFMKRIHAKWQMKLSLKANKFQKHYRPQVNF